MFEEYTQEYFVDQAVALGEKLGVDTRQGAVYMDAAMGHCIRTAKFYDDLRKSMDILSIDTCTDVVLDEKAASRNLYRKKATPSYYNVTFEGTPASELVGEKFMVSDYYFKLCQLDTGFYLQAEDPGTITNLLLPGQAVIPLKNGNLKSAILGEIFILGTDTESDVNLRRRLKELIVKSAENGNKQQYKTWCENFEGIGKAIIIPLGMGENTVKAILVSSVGKPPADKLVKEIQEFIDPKSEGLGEGAGLIGCHFYAFPVETRSINISFTATLSAGFTEESIRPAVEEKLVSYFRDFALMPDEEIEDEEQRFIQYVKVISILANIPGLADFTNLQLNGASANILIPMESVPVLGEVVFNASI